MTLEKFRVFQHLASEFYPTTNSMWVAQLRNMQNRMIGFSNTDANGIFSSELYEEKHERNGLYARINCQWNRDDSAVQTIVIGQRHCIERYARHDHKLLVPFSFAGIHYGEHKLFTDGSLEKDDILNQLPENLWYYVRPSSFVCTTVQLVQLPQIQLKNIRLDRVIGSGQQNEFFSHIHEVHEYAVKSPEENGVIITNSSAYISNHPELQFEELFINTIPQNNMDISYVE